MIIITKQQALLRWDALPDSLREALYSEPNSDFIWSTCRGENIPEQKIYDVSRIAGYVLLGFLHPEDVGQELICAIAIDQKTAKDIQDALIGRIFSPLRADIDKIYAPLSKSEISSTIATPKIIRDIGVMPPKPAPKPAPLSSVGWSKLSPSSIPTTPRPAAATITVPTPAPKPAPTPVMPSPAFAASMSAPAAPATAAPAHHAAEPAPMILHEDASFKAAEKNTSFTLARPHTGADMHMNQAPAASAPARPAVLEFGGIRPPAAPVNKTPSTAAPDAIRYADTGPRSVSQITPSAPTPPVPPKPPMPSSSNVPMPPMPPTPPMPPQTSKPIVKDFL